MGHAVCLESAITEIMVFFRKESRDAVTES